MLFDILFWNSALQLTMQTTFSLTKIKPSLGCDKKCCKYANMCARQCALLFLLRHSWAYSHMLVSPSYKEVSLKRTYCGHEANMNLQNWEIAPVAVTHNSWPMYLYG